MEFDWGIFIEKNSVKLIATAIAIVVFILLKYVSKKIVKKYGQFTHKAEGRMEQMRQIMAILINITFLFILAIIWGVRPDNLLVGLTTILTFLGVALFAQWSVLSNITAGIIMFFSAPYRLGDRIKIIDKDIPIVATIETIKTFYTHIRTDDGELIVLPNNIFLQKIISIETEKEE